MAVEDARPNFSWTLKALSSTLHGVAQSAYQVQVEAMDEGQRANEKIIWDSKQVNGESSFGISYGGAPLKPSHEYAWRVRVWDEHGVASGWSPMAHWTQAPVWHARWIMAATDNPTDPMPLFRKSFTVQKRVTRAVLHASGLGQQELRINGHKVGSDELAPGWSDYRKTVYYEDYDVTGMLRAGQNSIGMLLGNGMYRVLKTADRYTKFTGSYGPLECIVQLDIELADGEHLEIDSDGSWKTHRGPITFSSTYGGEDFDARKEERGWDDARFGDAGWTSVVVTDGPGGKLKPEVAPAIRVMHVYAPVKESEPKPGMLVYDLGQNFAGWPTIEVSGPAGSEIKLIPGELLNNDGTVSQRSSGGPQWFSYTLRGGGTESWHPRFSYYGFRYVQVEGATRTPGQGKPRILSLKGEAIHSSSRRAGSFVSSDERVNRIHELILHAIENNAESLFTDCPHREKLGWLEETHLMAPSMLYDFNFSGLYAATAVNVADAQRTEGDKVGMVPEITPQYVVFEPKYDVFNDSPEWGSAAVLAPWYAYQRSGDKTFLAAQLDVMRRYVDYLGARAHEGIIDYGLGDWYDIGPGPPGFSKLTTAGLTATAIYYQDLRVLERATALLDEASESAAYAHRAEQERDAFNARFFDSAMHRYDKGSQTAQAMPLAIGLVPDGERANVLDALVKDIRAHQNHVTAGDIGYHYVVDALLDGGRSDVLLDMLERTDSPSYGYQLAQGATSLTEAWDANPSSSQDHFMLGDAEEWLYRGLGGINVDLSDNGARRLLLHPNVLRNIAWVQTQYESSLGVVVSNWRRGALTTEYDFAIPVNATATLVVDTSSPSTVTVNGRPAMSADAISEAQASGKATELETAADSIGTHPTVLATHESIEAKSAVRLRLASGHYHVVAANAIESHP